MEYRSNTCEERSMNIDCSDLYERDIKRLYNAIMSYGPSMCVVGLCCLALEYSTLSYLHLATGIYFVNLWSYVIHRVMHSIPSSGIFSYLNIHVALHHSSKKGMPRSLELVVETLNNLMWFVMLYILQFLLNIHIVPDSILLLTALNFTSIHIINYSLFGSQKHREQHRNPHVNYGPDFFDHIFGTNSDETFENMTTFIPNTIGSFLLVKYLCRL
jgi:hypothetical protein